MKTTQIVIKSTEEFKKKVKDAAASDNITLSNYVTSLINDDFKKRKKNGTDKD